MLDPTAATKIALHTDRTNSFKEKGNVFNFFKMPYNEYSKIKDQGESGTGYTDPLHWTRHEKYIWFFTLLAGTSACYSARTTMPLVAPSISSDMKWSKTEVRRTCFFQYCKFPNNKMLPLNFH